MSRRFNIIFWGIVTIILFFIFGKWSGNYIYSFYFISFFVPVVISTSWFFSHVLVPRYLLQSKTRLFLLYTFFTIIVSIDLEMIIVFLAFMLISMFDYESMPLIISSYKWMPVIMYLIVILYGFIDMTVRLIRMTSRGNIPGTEEHFTVRSDRKNRIIRFRDVTYLESMSDYVRIFLIPGEMIVTRETISGLYEKLPPHFIRIHRSYIINTAHVDSFSKEVVIIGGKELPVSRTYRKEVLAGLSSLMDQSSYSARETTE
ncbi:MAG: LytTR family transcriptional regulator [Bacteroidales bacterium]|nr:LytTR family transcriptional regulator [Bacteroidales bacterium]